MEFEVESFSDDNVIISLYDGEVESNGIVSFDVSVNDVLAVAHKNGILEICSSSGQFETAFTINSSGGNYYVSWYENKLWVYILRRNIAICIDDVYSNNNTDYELYQIVDSTKNDEEWEQLFSRNEIQNNNTTYKMITTLPLSTQYDTIVKKSGNGKEEICFSVRDDVLRNEIDALLFLSLLIAIGLCVSVLLFKAHKRK